MKVKDLIKQLSKLDQNAKVGTFADIKYEFTFTPIEEIILQEQVELHEDFRRKGKKRFEDWVILAAPNQKWRGL